MDRGLSPTHQYFYVYLFISFLISFSLFCFILVYFSKLWMFLREMPFCMKTENFFWFNLGEHNSFWIKSVSAKSKPCVPKRITLLSVSSTKFRGVTKFRQLSIQRQNAMIMQWIKGNVMEVTIFLCFYVLVSCKGVCFHIKGRHITLYYHRQRKLRLLSSEALDNRKTTFSMCKHV